MDRIDRGTERENGDMSVLGQVSIRVALWRRETLINSAGQVAIHPIMHLTVLLHDYI
jgi:hypothetical protein